MAMQTKARRVGLVFAALADPTRRAILDELGRAPAGPTALARSVGVSQPAVSKHLKILGEAGLIKMRVRGRAHVCTVAPRPLDAAAVWLREARDEWTARLGAAGGAAHAGAHADVLPRRRAPRPRAS